MPRIPRGAMDGGAYHVLNRGNRKQEVFSTGQDYSTFVELLRMAKGRHPVSVFGYCLMPTHFHLVICARQGGNLSRFMQWLMTSHVRRHHQRRGTSGHVWQGRYKSFLIQQDSHLLTVLRYVERNPVRSGLVLSAGDWRWSSHRERIGHTFFDLLDRLPTPLPADWDRYVNCPLTDTEVEALQRSIRRRAPYGSAAWQQQICAEHGLEATLRRRGRPKNASKK